MSAHVFQKFIARRKISLYGERNAVIINNNMAKKIYNKNAREAHLMAEAYERVYNEDAEGDWAENTPAGREDGNEPDNRNILGINWYDIDPETHKMLSMAEDLLGNLDDSGYSELAQRGISGVDDNYDNDAINMLYNLQDQGWTTGSKAWKLSREIVKRGLDGLASEDAEVTAAELRKEYRDRRDKLEKGIEEYKLKREKRPPAVVTDHDKKMMKIMNREPWGNPSDPYTYKK